MEKNLTRRGALCVFGAVAAGALAGCTAADTTATPASSGEAGQGGSEGSGADANGASNDQGSGSSTVSDGSSQAADPAPAAPTETAAQKTLDSMSLEQKVAQLFFVTPEELTGVEVAIVAGSMTANALSKIPVGGMIYFARNIEGSQQLRDLLSGSVELSKQAGVGVPIFTGVDEEGGTLVARIANSGYFDVQTFPNMREIGDSGDSSQAANVGTVIGSYLRDIGFTVDFAPDADVLTNPDNKVIGQRAFGSDPAVVSSMVSAEVEAMMATQTMPCAKHFPGHGDTEGDSHTGAATSNRSMSDLESCEFLPFEAAIEAGIQMIMVGHIETPNAAADGLPASLSSKMITDILRGELGFDGIVVSDAMNMGAITDYYAPADAAVAFIQAGGDMILMPDDLEASYQGVLGAVSSGAITEERINQSALRVLTAKQAAGLLS